MKTRSFLLTIVVAIACLPGVTRAVDGTIEINQLRAIAGGITATDTPGFPITLDAPGQYRLTGNIEQSSDAAAIFHVTSHDVRLDLNGFTVRGPNACSGTPVTSCTYSGAPPAIEAFVDRLDVRNGRIVGAAGRGIVTGNDLRVDDLEISESGSDGMNVAERLVATSLRLRSNLGSGLVAFGGSIVRDSLAHANAGDGFSLSGVLSGCTATVNGSDGVSGSDVVVRDCVIDGNSSPGIITGVVGLALDRGGNAVAADGSIEIDAHRIHQGGITGPILAQTKVQQMPVLEIFPGASIFNAIGYVCWSDPH